MIKKPELLAPAGNMEKMKMALWYGADAVYLGGRMFGLRAFGGNFTHEELEEAVCFAHALKKKVYVTVNIFPHNSDLEKLPEYLRYLMSINVDAILVADLGVFSLAREIVPEMPIHISTQANTTNWMAVNAWKNMGAERVVLAREMSFAEICEIRERCQIELEVFVHGAMCISYSGRCLLSNYFTGRDSNRGSCAQPCRWKYSLVEEKRPGQYFPIMEDNKGTYIFNSKDLCLLSYIPDIIRCGIDSLKIEGRMKSAHYVATITKAYRLAIDNYFSTDDNYFDIEDVVAELNKVSHREYTTGFFDNSPDVAKQIYSTSSYQQTTDFIGLVLDFDAENNLYVVEQRNNFKKGEKIEVFQPNGKTFTAVIGEMTDENGIEINVAPHPQQIVKIGLPQKAEPYSILRRYI